MQATPRFERTDRVQFVQLDDEYLAVDVDTESCISLNVTGVAIWDALCSPVTVADICEGLARDYEVEADACAGDVAAFVGRLSEAGLVRQVGAPDER